MPNNYFTFKQFTIIQDRCSFKVGTDGVLLGASADITGTLHILDIGTGSGLIALMLAQRSEAEITAIEPDHNSYIQACENVRKSKWFNRIKVLNTSLQDYNSGNRKFDLIISNPPYFTDSYKNPDTGKAVSRHKITLNNDELLTGVTRLLKDSGRLQVIMPYAEGTVFIAEAREYGLYCNNIVKITPLPASEIRRLILTFSGKKLITKENLLTIEKGNRHDFTEEYKNLTKDFYLRF
ncbi:MAG: methyltransferase [Bacteroidales bacterium]|nr:methyltransferase [Bacteroidales bacterium]